MAPVEARPWHQHLPGMCSAHDRNSPGSAASGFSLESSGHGEGSGGEKPNKPNATDYQQPLTAQEAPGNLQQTVGTRRDSHRKTLTQFTPMELQIRGAPEREDTCYNYSHLNFITKFTLYITFWTNFLPFHDQHSRQHSLAWVATSDLSTRPASCREESRRQRVTMNSHQKVYFTVSKPLTAAFLPLLQMYNNLAN